MHYPKLDDSVPFAEIQRVLVIKLRHYGDVLLTSPVFQVLKNHYPHLEIDALIYKETEDMLRYHPSIENIFFVDKRWKKKGKPAIFKQEKRLLNQLNNRQYDLVIHLTESWRGAWLARWLKPKYSVVRRYTKRKSTWWMSSFTHHYASPEANCRHTVEMHLDALRRLGLQPEKDERRLVLIAGEAAEKSTAKKTGSIDKPLVVVHPTSRWFFKCWDEDKFVSVIDHLAQAGYQVVLTASAEEKELAMAGRIAHSAQTGMINLAGKLGLKELAALIDKAELFIGVDSVPMHIASAMQTPTVVLFGPSGDVEWGPWMNQAEVVTSKHTCRPCGQDGCGNSKVSDCLMEVKADAVILAVEKQLSCN